jgi:hypothetical protein
MISSNAARFPIELKVAAKPPVPTEPIGLADVQRFEAIVGETIACG